MSFISGTIVGNATPSTELVTLIEAQLTAHAAWEFVEETVSGNSTIRVWRNLGLLNDFGTDFYLAIFRLTASIGTSNVYFSVGEEYSTVTHQVTRAVGNPASTVTPDATYNAYQGATAAAWNSASWNTLCFSVTSTVSMEYFIAVTKNFLLVKTSPTPTYAIYAGLFQPFFPSNANEFPLVLCPFGNTDIDGAGSVSRRPTVTTSMLDAFAIYCDENNSNVRFESVVGTLADTSSSLYQSGDGPVGMRAVVYHTTSTGGSMRGLYYDVLIFSQHADVGRGDTVTINGSTYYCVDDGGSYGVWISEDVD